VGAHLSPRRRASQSLIGNHLPVFGKYEQAVEESRKAIELDPDTAIGYVLLASSYQNLDLLGETEKTLQRASERKLEIPDFFLVQRYDIAFLRGDKAGMEREAVLGRSKAGVEHWISDKEAFAILSQSRPISPAKVANASRSRGRGAQR